MFHRRDHHVDLLDHIHRALVIVQITQDEIDAQNLEVLDDFGLCYIGGG